MLIEIVFALILGLFAGTITGLSPGIHINLVATFLTASIGAFSGIPLIVLVVFIVAMSMTHTFLDFIPSIFLGAPEEDSFLSVLPGHQLLKEGKGHEAYIMTIYGSLIALLMIIIFTPVYILFLPTIFTTVKFAIPFILIFISLYLIFREEKPMLSFITFSLAGILGFLTFNLPVKEPLMPLLSGLFGLSALFISLRTKSQIQKQNVKPLKETKIERKNFFKSIAAVLISSPFCAFLPGIGSGHAATIGSEIIPQDKKGFLFLVGATNTMMMGLSFITIYAIGKARSGSAVAIQEILKSISQTDLLIILATIIISGIIAVIIGINLSKFCAKYISKINYLFLTGITITIIFFINLIFTNFLGIFILVVATSLGIFTILSKSRRINMMGALIIPTIIYYLL